MTGQLTPTRGALRVVRGGVLAVTSATLAVVAHVLAGGAVPDSVVTVLPAVGVAAIGIAMAGRRHSIGGVLAVLGGAQLVSHVLLSVETMNMAGMNGLAMLGAHAIAVSCTTVLLVKADAAVFAVAAALARFLPSVVTPPPVPEAPARPRPSMALRVRPTVVLLCRGNSRRGPPVAA